MVIMNATKARQNFFQLMNSEMFEPVIVVGKHKNKVIIDEDEWRGIQETLYLESIPGVKEKILAAHKEADTDLVDESEVVW